jgi:hypothetical protein
VNLEGVTIGRGVLQTGTAVVAARSAASREAVFGAYGLRHLRPNGRRSLKRYASITLGRVDLALSDALSPLGAKLT